MLIINLIQNIFLVYTIMLFIRILGSWVPEFQQNRFMLFVAFYTDPYLNLFRRIIPPLGMIDISPFFAFICLGFIEQIILALLLYVIT